MKQRRRIYYSTEQREEIWERWRRGESMSSIGRLFERGSSSIYKPLEVTGGIRPPVRKRSQYALTMAERETISRGLAANRSIRGIASELGRSPSTVSREVSRNGGQGSYRATRADEAVWERVHRPKPCKLSLNGLLKRNVSKELKINWSPEQIAGWLKREYPGDEKNQVSHETIYRSLYVQARGVLKKELQSHLRASRSIRRSRHASVKTEGFRSIKDAVSISDRPPSVEDRAIPGHWEGDLIGGSKNSYIATLVERHSRYVILVKITIKILKASYLR
jgi:IS30 family transposase